MSSPALIGLCRFWGQGRRRKGDDLLESKDCKYFKRDESVSDPLTESDLDLTNPFRILSPISPSTGI